MSVTLSTSSAILGQIPSRWPSGSLPSLLCWDVVLGKAEAFVEVRASAITFLPPRELACPKCFELHHKESSQASHPVTG